MAVKDWGYKHPNLVGATAEEVRDVMIKGESGILACSPPDFQPIYKKSEKKLIWPNGVETLIYYGSEPDHARGPQSDFLWADELAKYLYPEETFDNLLLGLRLGPNPLCIITSTPQPTKFLMELEKRTDENGNRTCIVTHGNTEDNRVNLSPVFINTIIGKYKGTRLGRQELEGAFLDENPDALWKMKNIEENRVHKIPSLEYVVVGVDPAATSSEGSDDTGIIVAARGTDRHGYILGDYTCHETPAKWGTAVITAYNAHEANKVIAEINNGGEMVENTIKVIDMSVPVETIHASRGKYLRAEPVSALYEKNLIHHFGTFKDLESQMCEWVPGAEKSPDRCFIKGTLIMTKQGNIPIENIIPGMEVLTRKGFKRVAAAGTTSHHAKTISVNFSNGKTLTGTPNHPIWVEGKGFCKMDALVYADKVLTCCEKQLNTKELLLLDIQNLKAYREAAIFIHLLKCDMVKRFKPYTKRSGKLHTDQFQKGTTSTTLTEILETILLKISNVCQKKNMLKGILKTENQKNNLYTLRKSAHSLKNGMHQKKGINGTVSTGKKHGRIGKSLTAYVKTVGKLLKQNVIGITSNSAPEGAVPRITGKPGDSAKSKIAQNAEKSSVQINTDPEHTAPVSVLGLQEEKSQTVYNISVEGCNEYFANGILVHNCDALVYAVTALNLYNYIGGDQEENEKEEVGYSLASIQENDVWDEMF